MTEQQEERLVNAVEKAATALVRIADATGCGGSTFGPSCAGDHRADQAVQAIIEQNRMMIQALFSGVEMWIRLQTKPVVKE